METTSPAGEKWKPGSVISACQFIQGVVPLVERMGQNLRFLPTFRIYI